MEEEAWNILINALVVIAGGVLFARFLGRRFDEIGCRSGQSPSQLDRLHSGSPNADDRFQRIELRFDQIDARFDRIAARMDSLQRSLDAMRTELTQVALAVGATSTRR
jgi:hypothetical protein